MVRVGLLILAVAACGSPQSRPVAGTEPEQRETERGAIPEDVVGPPNVAWSELDHTQRAKFMERVVLPRMKPLFSAFDAKQFHEVNCATCHGEAAVKDHTFKMPNPTIFVLPATRDGFQALAKDKPEWMKFMSTEVQPEVAKLLGLPELDPAHPSPKAFGCLHCHTSKQASAS
jgi:hypothetical protein